MSKVKKSETEHYELLYIISNKYGENELNPIMEKVKSAIKEGEGNITYGEEWGKKRLAYPIKHFNYGYYVLLEFDAVGAKLSALDRTLRLMNEVLRHQIVKKEIKAAGKKEKSERVAPKAAEKERAEKDKAKEKTNLKDLDERLDKILETNDLL